MNHEEFNRTTTIRYDQTLIHVVWKDDELVVLIHRDETVKVPIRWVLKPEFHPENPEIEIDELGLRSANYLDDPLTYEDQDLLDREYAPMEQDSWNEWQKFLKLCREAEL